MDVELKAATLANLDELLILVRAYHDFECIKHTDESRRAALLPLLAEDAAPGRVWLILSSGQTVGYVAICFGYSIEFGGRDAFIDELYIVESARDKGIGTGVLERVKSEAARLGVLVLHLEVGLDNQRARRLYSRAGFESRDRFHLMSCLVHNLGC
ncbi:MAG TPA: GNAT family N-acetyltransferase [Gammaproteobacteria bacterium]